jgi:hypothetical protein
MVVVQRNEVSRIRVILILVLILSATTLAGVVLNFSAASDAWRLFLLLLGAVSAVAAGLALLQLYTYPKRSQVLLIQNDNGIVVATNMLHEGYKLRFLRDILGDQMSSFSDEERVRWKSLEADGFYATLCVRDVRKLIMLRLCMMIFDDVFYVDRSNRWEHHDSSSTAEPSFSKREMPRLTSWKSST